MKKLMIYGFIPILFVLISADQNPPNWAKFPDKMKAEYSNKGYSIVEAGPGNVAQRTEIWDGSGPYKDGVVTKRLTLPSGASNIKVHAFMQNSGNGCTGQAWWFEGFDHDHGWCSMHMTGSGTSGNGQQYYEVTFKNWSDCDTRRYYFFVAYKP